ncbi:DUF2975 domain-containing protein [Deinococcus sp.]|uniref:DUF2975 domain-containing protein n=1 Tax=Deinococcus sp. TaxID=47478 RepID=UPI0025E39074|nr:DUF2975 domain-containing protein [Deinococcus sp.]
MSQGKATVSSRNRVTFALVALTILDAITLLFFLALCLLCVLAFNGVRRQTGVQFSAVLAGVLIMGSPTVAAWLFHLLLVSARYADPFSRTNVRRLNWMGLLVLLAWLLTSNWWASIAQWFGPSQEFGFPPIVNGNLQINSFVLALFLFGLAGVIARGVQLREEQDLTV